MLHALSILAAAAEGEAEPSKTPFYLAGGLLVLWALALSGMGMSRATFPDTARAKSGVIAVTTVLMVAAMATAVITG